MSLLAVHLSIPVPLYGGLHVDGMLFNAWFPLDAEDELEGVHEGCSVSISFDPACAPEYVARENFRLANNQCLHVRAVVRTEKPDIDIHEWLTTRSVSDEMRPVLVTLIRSIHEAATVVANRLFAYVRGVKGQYWVAELHLNSNSAASTLSSWGARFETSDGRSTDWPKRYGIGDVVGPTPFSDARYITKSDWSAIQEFVAQGSRAPLVGELLCRAEELATRGQRRVALSEAVTALEIAVSTFEPSVPEVAAWHRFDLPTKPTSLSAHVSRLGFSASVQYLLPVVVSPDRVATRDWHECAAAVRERQNVVHKGQRDVKEDDLASYLRVIRRVCTQLGGDWREYAGIPAKPVTR